MELYSLCHIKNHPFPLFFAMFWVILSSVSFDVCHHFTIVFIIQFLSSSIDNKPFPLTLRGKSLPDTFSNYTLWSCDCHQNQSVHNFLTIFDCILLFLFKNQLHVLMIDIFVVTSVMKQSEKNKRSLKSHLWSFWP